MKQAPVKVRRKFDETFKREAVQNWLSSGKSAEVIAEELGLKANLLYAWKKCFAPADAGGRAAGRARAGWLAHLVPCRGLLGKLADLQAQLEAARRENRHLREQRDILKKTLGILSEPSMNATNGSTR